MYVTKILFVVRNITYLPTSRITADYIFNFSYSLYVMFKTGFLVVDWSANHGHHEAVSALQAQCKVQCDWQHMGPPYCA